MTQTIINLGTGGAALNGQNGSTAGADSNDAQFLDWTGENYVYLPGVVANSISVPDEAALDITGDIDIRAQVALNVWNSANIQGFVNKWNTPQQSYSFLLQAEGRLQFNWSTNGSDNTNRATPTGGSGRVPFAAGEVGWVRVTVDVDNGAGGADIKFFTSYDGVTWTQLSTTITTDSTISIHSGTQPVNVGWFGGAAAFGAVGKFYRAQIWNGIEGSGGTKVLDIDTSVITAGNQTTFTAVTGQTVTIARSTAGRKSVAVVSPVWLFGTDDYWEVPDNALLDFGASDSFTLVAIHRPWATQGTNDTLIAKKANTTNTTAGYNLSGGSSTALAGQAQIGDGAAGITAVSGSRTSGALTITAAVRNVTTDDLIVYLNGTAGTAVTDTTTSAISNAEVFRIARLSGAGTEYADMELISVAVFRRALTVAEIAALTTYYQNRLS